jgi:membrane associated rhomboid family serine protease
MSFSATPASLAILVVTVGLSLLGLFAAPRIIEQNLFRPYWLKRKGQLHTVVSSGFIHADLAHLLFNMFTFFFFAFPLERHIGTASFALLYLVGLVASHAGTYVKHQGNPEYASLGASGAIAAVLFAYIVYFPGSTLFIIPFPFPIPAPVFALAYMAYSIYSSRQARGRINHDAHLWGAISGLVFVALTDMQAYRALL